MTRYRGGVYIRRPTSKHPGFVRETRTDARAASAPFEKRRDLAYKELKKTLALAKQAEERDAFGQVVTRFSDTTALLDRWRKAVLATRKYTVDELREFMRLCRNLGTKKAAEQTGIPYKTIRSYWRNRRLPATGPFRFVMMKLLVEEARRIYTSTNLTPLKSLNQAADMRRLHRERLRIFLSFELIPGIPGFPLYMDPEAQLRCERYARLWPKVTTGAPIFDP